MFCGDKTMGKLNLKYRGKSEATDILSFSQDEGEILPIHAKGGTVPRKTGDIVISLETLRENARYFKISEDEELRRLIIHGILHIDGMNHKTNKKTEPMLKLQEKILSDLNGFKILPDAGLSLGSNK